MANFGDAHLFREVLIFLLVLQYLLDHVAKYVAVRKYYLVDLSGIEAVYYDVQETL